MQKLFMVFVLMLASTQLFAQKKFAVDKGSFIIGGSAGFSSTGDSGNDRFTEITVNPILSFFIVPNLAIGGSGSLSRFSASGSSNTSIGFGPSVAYYFGDMNSKSYPFVSSSLFYRKQSDFLSIAYLQVFAGVAFMVAKNVAVTSKAFFLLINEIQDGSNDAGNSFGINIGIATFIF